MHNFERDWNKCSKNYAILRDSIVELCLSYRDWHFPDVICKPGWFSLPPHGCYQIFDEPVLWVEAGNKCSEQNGSLTSWETWDEFVVVKTFLQNNFCEFTVNRLQAELFLVGHDIFAYFIIFRWCSDLLRLICMNDNCYIFIGISQKKIPLAQSILRQHYRTGNEPLMELMMA